MKLLFSFFLSLSFFSNQAQIEFTGRVQDELKQGIPSALIKVHELNKAAVTGLEGGFFFSNMQSGRYHVHVESVGYQSFTLDTVINQSFFLEIKLKESVNELDEVVIEIGKQDQEESSVELRHVSKEELEQNSSPSLAETLEHIEGVQTQNMGVSVAKPVIRGLRNNRALIVSDNVRQEEQQWGDDHGMAIDQFGVDEATVIRGPSALIYGSDAIGGVIKLDRDIHLAKNTHEADVTTFYRSVNNTIGVSAGMKMNTNDTLIALRLGMADYGDYKVPADNYTYLGYKLPIYDNKLKNTAGKEYNASLILGKNTKWGYSKVTISDYYQKVGVFSGATGLPAFYNLTPDGDRNIDLPYQEVNHFKVVSESSIAFNENWLDLIVGFQNNRRKEYSLPRASGFPYPESESLANDLRLQTLNANANYHFKPKGRHEDLVGVQLDYQQNLTAGFDYVLPNYKKLNTGAYGIRKWKVNDKLEVNMGVRFDFTSLHTEATYTPFYHQLEYKKDILRAPELNNNYVSWAGNFGLAKKINDKNSYKLNFGKSFRAPQAIELTSNGAHAGTFRFEKGDPNLSAENAFQLDGGYSFENKRHHFTLTPFVTYFDNYIYLAPSNVFPKEVVGDEVLPYAETGQMYVYKQNKAVMSGGEVLYHYHPKEWFKTGVQFDMVFAQNIETGRPLPMTPPTRGKVFVSLIKKHKKEKSYLTINFTQTASQNRVDKNEKVTEGYSLVNLALGSTFKKFELKIHVQNLTNTNYLKHLSLYRQLNIPEPSTNFNVLLKYVL
jgi:iron complex outermembrane receptor protein